MSDGEKVQGLVFNIQDYAVNDGPGIRTTVFLKGCPLRCLWCANPEGQAFGLELMHSKVLCKKCGRCISFCQKGAISLAASGFPVFNQEVCKNCGEHSCTKACLNRALKTAGKYWSAEDLYRKVQTNALFYRNSGGGVTLSGGEPLAQPEFVREFLQLCTSTGLSVGVETSGLFIWEKVEDFIDKLDFYFFDLKCLDPVQHEQILQNLRNLAQIAAEKITVTLAVIPGVNDDLEMAGNAAKLCSELGIRQIRLLPYHTMGAGKYEDLGREYLMEDGLTADLTLLERMVEEIKDRGIECWIE